MPKCDVHEQDLCVCVGVGVAWVGGMVSYMHVCDSVIHGSYMYVLKVYNVQVHDCISRRETMNFQGKSGLSGLKKSSTFN